MKNFAKRVSALVLALVVGATALCPAAFAWTGPGGDPFLKSQGIGVDSALQHPADSEKTLSIRRGRRGCAGL